jgi:hypothetical protein
MNPLFGNPPPPPPKRRKGIEEWVVKHSGPSTTELIHEAELASAEKRSEVVVVGYFNELAVSGFTPPLH